MDEQPLWEAWRQNESRCPYCIGLDDPNFHITCDCWRLDWEIEQGLVKKAPVYIDDVKTTRPLF